ncbi:hypothetical protein EVAR_25797_1 [Eumeta japonica]|uniref:Uncharacterized protein n=1 Tax=Eumeta variegata TaxID=151549 RepID=A0A4C1VUW5_EUMVA|nr:hypothetical protein EVAR_25797_1 [Eumeta japonica]
MTGAIYWLTPKIVGSLSGDREPLSKGRAHQPSERDVTWLTSPTPYTWPVATPSSFLAMPATRLAPPSQCAVKFQAAPILPNNGEVSAHRADDEAPFTLRYSTCRTPPSGMSRVDTELLE